ncbi:hypothetical protein [Burkholderia ambifaria]|jgi:hypothetical protein|uniref:Uncharacterized protein n=1 Tax=Burkholderia ambifaria IOP40-10 TaxID=396596 RepID=B1FAY1_9BURK|nr:hypothetical protein [Burkholderia ambifaria]EDT05255.1 hypothetical protein BamIOP4010DRAFT_1190 [Burkholderia ambifaria IOP40-10]
MTYQVLTVSRREIVWSDGRHTVRVRGEALLPTMAPNSRFSMFLLLRIDVNALIKR